jgi:hypothetical protein
MHVPSLAASEPFGATGMPEGELRYAAGILSGDADGDGNADFEIGVNAATLGRADPLSVSVNPRARACLGTPPGPQ